MRDNFNNLDKVNVPRKFICWNCKMCSLQEFVRAFLIERGCVMVNGPFYFSTV